MHEELNNYVEGKRGKGTKVEEEKCIEGRVVTVSGSNVEENVWKKP